MPLTKIFRGDSVFWRDGDSGRLYTDDWLGGFSWPGDTPGYFLLLAQQTDAKIMQIDEGKFDTLDALAEKITALQYVYPMIGYWVAESEPQGETLNYTDTLVDLCERRNCSVVVSHPEMDRSLRLAIQVLRNEFRQKGLSLLKGGIAAAKIVELDTADLTDSKAAERFSEVLVLARTVFEFPHQEDRAERLKPKDKWGDWMDGGDSGTDGKGGWMGA